VLCLLTSKRVVELCAARNGSRSKICAYGLRSRQLQRVSSCGVETERPNEGTCRLAIEVVTLCPLDLTVPAVELRYS